MVSAALLARDAGFRRWLAARPGLWLEIGAFDEPAVLVGLMAERRTLGLPQIAALRRERAGRVRHRARRASGLAGTTGGSSVEARV